jgi:uncharacterized protein YecE (DUF72 family)
MTTGTPAHSGKSRIGTSGYQYSHWKGGFYPEILSRSDWFQHYARFFDTVEINNTFYGLPQKSVFARWKAQAPDDFCFTLKFSRYGSHQKRLLDPENTIGVFLEHARELGNRLGPILVQLKPKWHVDVERLRAFLQAAPRDQRWAFEFRDPSWLCEPVFEALRDHQAALCIHDLIEKHPYVLTTDWVYLRYHGEHYSGSYGQSFLHAQAKRIASHLAEGLDVFAYFNNDAQGFAVENALDLKRYVDELQQGSRRVSHVAAGMS